ncbi:unnamed protein product, partial [Phaeothamnion confervicola]
SPFGLLEELLAPDPWRILLSCILLNKTSRRQVDAVLAELLAMLPNATAAAAADPVAIEPVIRPLGLHEKRSRAIVRFSREFLARSWRSPRELHFVGQYGEDAYNIFCVPGGWQQAAEPHDHALNWYVDFCRGNAAFLGPEAV